MPPRHILSLRRIMEHKTNEKYDKAFEKYDGSISKFLSEHIINHNDYDIFNYFIVHPKYGKQFEFLYDECFDDHFAEIVNPISVKNQKFVNCIMQFINTSKLEIAKEDTSEETITQKVCDFMNPKDSDHYWNKDYKVVGPHIHKAYLPYKFKKYEWMMSHLIKQMNFTIQDDIELSTNSGLFIDGIEQTIFEISDLSLDEFIEHFCYDKKFDPADCITSCYSVCECEY